MPELPEVETMRRGIEPIVGSTICAVARTRCRKKPISIRPTMPEFRRRVLGRTIQATERLGKRVVVRLDDDQRIVFEPRMTGLVLIDEPPNRQHLRWELQLASNRHPYLWFWDRRGLGSVRLFRGDEFAQFFESHRLGRDALLISLAEMRDVLGTSPTPIKVALLDQRRVAGIGNLYAAEILHRARVHPQLPCRQLAPQQWDRVRRAVRTVLQQAIRLEGSTLSDGTYRNALNQPGQYQSRHLVYDREGDRCLVCQRASIERIVQAQRSTFFCPRCQVLPNGRGRKRPTPR